MSRLLYKLLGNFRGLIAFGTVALKKRTRVGRRFLLNCTGANVMIGHGVVFGNDCGIAIIGNASGAPVSFSIGDKTSFQDRCHINSKIGIEIGSCCAISWDVEFLDTDFHKVINFDGSEVINSARIRIGDNCWIGARAIILKGVSLGNGCVVAAGSVVTKSFPKNSLIAGNPARLVREIKGWVL